MHSRYLPENVFWPHLNLTLLSLVKTALPEEDEAVEQQTPKPPLPEVTHG
jgi:hypothetical protein